MAVACFLEGRIGFTDIGLLIENVLTRSAQGEVSTLEDVLEADRAARICAERYLGSPEAAARPAAGLASARLLSP